MPNLLKRLGMFGSPSLFIPTLFVFFSKVLAKATLIRHYDPAGIIVLRKES